MKINKGHWHELADRTFVECNNIQNNIINHVTVSKNKKLQKLAIKAQECISKICQHAGMKF